jgi:hypothetical protein
VRYPDWLEVVLRAILERPAPQVGFGMQQLGAALGQAGAWGAPERRGFDMALSAAVDDLAERHLLDAADRYDVAATTAARRFARHSLRDLWPQLRAGELVPDEEAYLAALAKLSEVEHEDWAEVRWVPSGDVFDALGWPYDRNRSWRLLPALVEGVFVEASSTNDNDTVRLRWAGAVRVSDEVGAVMAEARDLLAVGRLRAVGCIAGVELERQLKALAVARELRVSQKPSITTYNNVLRKAQRPDRSYLDTTYHEVHALAALRNLFAHVLDREPTAEDGADLLDRVEAVIRALPTAAHGDGPGR